MGLYIFGYYLSDENNKNTFTCDKDEQYTKYVYAYKGS